jgi:REP element-mobilizing transposase RayT
MSELTRARMSVESYNRFLESGFWQNGQKISTFAAFEIAANLYPNAAQIWLERLIFVASCGSVTVEQVRKYVENQSENLVPRRSANAE